MMQKKIINLDTWDRKDAYRHYISFDNPSFNLTAPLEIGALYDYCKQRKQNLYFSYLYLATRVVNEIKEFHYRIENKEVVYYEKIDCAPTVLDENKKLLFSHLNYNHNAQQFIKNSQEVTNKVLKDKILDPGDQLSVIYATVIPWVAFTGLRHPVFNKGGNGIPVIAFGKIYEQGKHKFIPIALDVHHALMDGYHAGLFFEKLQEYFSNPSILEAGSTKP